MKILVTMSREISMVKTTNVLSIPVAQMTRTQVLQKIKKHLKTSAEQLFIVTANPEIIMLTKEDATYRKAVLQADYVLPDGIGVMIGAKILGDPLPEKIPGYELVHDLLQLSSNEGFSVYFYGAKKGIAQQAADNAKALYQGLDVAGIMDGYHYHGEEAADWIQQSNPNIIFVAMGAPRQEQWIAEYKARFPNSVLIGVGGSFDVLSGAVKRAPKFWTKRNLEWFYRLVTQPTRAKRMLKIPLFLLAVLKEKLFSKKK